MFGWILHGEPQNGTKPVTVPMGWRPGMESIAWFAVERTVGEWVEIAKRREAGDGRDEVRATIIVDDGFDDGVSDTYEVVQGGCPLRPSAQRNGQWILDTSPESSGVARFAFVEQPMTRRYFLSKRGEQPLDDSQPRS